MARRRGNLYIEYQDNEGQFRKLDFVDVDIIVRARESRIPKGGGDPDGEPICWTDITIPDVAKALR